MGRPIKKKYFGNTNVKLDGEGVGGEQFAAIAVATTGTLYNPSTSYTWLASVPQIAGGQRASGTLSISPVGGVSAFNFTDGGSGYTSTASVTVAVSPATTGSAATYVISLTASQRQNAIKFNSYIPVVAGGSAAVGGGDIVKQEGSHAYLVKNSEGTGICRLVTTSALSAGQMNIVATDANGSTYYVKKLTAHKAVLVQSTASGSFLVANNGVSAWTFGSAASGVVSITNN